MFEEYYGRCSITVGDVMSKQIISLSPEDTLQHALTLFIDHHITGVPVTDSENRIVGIISEFALMDLLFDPKLKSDLVRDYMTKEVKAVDVKDSATKLAHVFALYCIRRLPVLKDGVLVGVVTRHDILKHFSESEETLEGPAFQIPLIECDDYIPSTTK